MPATDEQSVIVLDFETTGLSPDQGDRAIEIGAVLLKNNEVVDRFSSLMNSGLRIGGFIEEQTGITNEMLLSGASIRRPPMAKKNRAVH